jgi:GTP-binding protein
MTKPIVAIVGRPNVGKSTFFNRIIGQRRAIVEDEPGTTRDRLYGDGEWTGVEFVLVDTGGLVLQDIDDLTRHIRQQVEMTMAEADAIIFMVDAKTGLTAADEDVADLLRYSKKPVFLAANKADNEERRLAANEFYVLGLDYVYPISSLHGTGTGDLLDAVVAALPRVPEPAETDSLHIAIVGRPNVGKSSLLNKLLGQSRTIVSPVPGTTRDAIDSTLDWNGTPITLIDTAGIRRRGKIERGVEKYSILRALRAIGRSDVVCLLLDIHEGVTSQDAHIAGYILEAEKSVIVAANKWDLIKKDTYTYASYEKLLRRELRFLDYVPILFISALTGQRAGQVLDTAIEVYHARKQRVSTSDLNRLVQEVVARHAPPSKRGRRLRFYYATQAGVAPPTFVFFVNDPELVHFSYRRYLENQIRLHFPFPGTPLRFHFRKRAD